MTEIKTRAFTGIVGLTLAGLMSVGCSSSSNTTGTAGTTGSAGTSGAGTAGTTGTATGNAGTTGTAGTGNTTGNAGATGTGGSGGATLCTGGPLTGAPLISDFSTATASDGGTANTIPNVGGISGYTGVTVTIEGGHAHATGTVAAGAYAGVSLYFSSCIDASSYTGVKFALTGSFGTCDMLKLGVTFPQVEPPPPASGFGVCTTGANCYGPGTAYTVSTTMVTFASMSGGGAVATVTADGQDRLTGVGFGFHGPAGADGGAAGGCTVDFTIDDVAFY